MTKPQQIRDSEYLVTLSIFTRLHQKGLVTDRELVKIAAFLAEKFSASAVVRMRKIG